MRILLNIAAISPALTGDSYIVILKEVNTPMRSLPIIIGPNEANAIVLQMQGKKPARPMTHDLLNSVILDTGMSVEYICIRSLENGVYKSDIAIRNKKQIILIDSRTSDAIALAVRCNCSIFVESDILDESGVYDDEVENEVEHNDSIEKTEKKTEKKEENKKVKSKKSLEEDLKEAIRNEDYEEAARIRDEISGQ